MVKYIYYRLIIRCYKHSDIPGTELYSFIKKRLISKRWSLFLLSQVHVYQINCPNKVSKHLKMVRYIGTSNSFFSDAQLFSAHFDTFFVGIQCCLAGTLVA